MIKEEWDGSVDNHLDPGMKEIISYLRKQGVTTLFSCVGHWVTEKGRKRWSKPYLVFDINEKFAKFLSEKYKIEKTKLYTLDDKQSKITMGVYPKVEKGNMLQVNNFWNYVMAYKKVNNMKTLKTITEEELSVESAYTQLQELLKAQQELTGFSKQNPAIGQNQNLQRILNQLTLQGQGLNKSLQTLIAQKKQASLLQAKAQQQGGQVTPLNKAQPGQVKPAQGQANTTPTPGTPMNANGAVGGTPQRTP